VELTFENSIFEINLERKKSEPIPTVIPQTATSQATTPTGSNQDLTTAGGGGGTSRSERLARKRSKSRSTQGDFRIQLTLEQKLDIIVLEFDQAKNEKTRRETANEKKIDQLQVCHFFPPLSPSNLSLVLSLMLNGSISNAEISN
jgi:hypothetical protein